MYVNIDRYVNTNKLVYDPLDHRKSKKIPEKHLLLLH